jgi:hypothetical protein
MDASVMIRSARKERPPRNVNMNVPLPRTYALALC